MSEQIEVKKLVEGIEYLSPGVGKGAFSLSKNLFLLKNKLVTFNGNILVIDPLNINIKGMVDFDTFNNLIKDLNGNIETIEIKQTEKNIILTTGKKKKSLKITFSNIDIEENASTVSKICKKIKDLSWKKFDAELKSKIILASFCASTDYTMPELTGVFVSNKNIMCGSDFRFIRFKNKHSIDSFLIPATSAIHLNKFNIKEYSINKNWIYFRTKEKIIFGSSLLPVKTYDEKRFLEHINKIDNKGMEEFPKELKAIVKRSLIFLKGVFDLDKQIELTISKKQITVITKKETLKSEEGIKCKLPNIKETIIVKINPLFLVDALSHSTKFKVIKNKIVIFSEDFIHLINLR